MMIEPNEAERREPLKDARRVDGPMWTVDVRLSLVVIAMLPAVTVWLTPDRQERGLIMHAAILAAPLALTLVVATLYGFIVWSATTFRDVLLWGSGVLYGLWVLILIGTKQAPYGFEQWGGYDWWLFSVWLGSWAISLLCAWIVTSRLVYPWLLRLRQSGTQSGRAR